MDRDHTQGMIQKWSAEHSRARHNVVRFARELRSRRNPALRSKSGSNAGAMLKYWSGQERRSRARVEYWRQRLWELQQLQQIEQAEAAADSDQSLPESTEHLLAALKVSEAYVVRKRYGLWDGNIETLAQVAAPLKVSRERVRQIQQEALEKMALNVGRIASLRTLLSDSPEAGLVSHLLADIPQVLPKERKAYDNDQCVQTRANKVLRRIGDRYPGKRVQELSDAQLLGVKGCGRKVAAYLRTIAQPAPQRPPSSKFFIP